MRLFNRTFFYSLLFLPLFSLSNSSNAAIITLTPSATEVFVGDVFSVDVSVSDLEQGQVLALFDLNVLFDDALADLVNIIFGTALNDGNVDDSFQFPDLFGPVNTFELSFLPQANLQSLQQISFSILNLEFEALAVGLLDVGIDVLELGFLDFVGDDISVSEINAASVQINERATAVDEPASLALLSIALIALLGRRKRKFSF